MILSLVLIAATAPVHAADPAAAALNDALQLVGCMKGFDAACVVHRTYTEYLERQGTRPDQISKAVSDLYAQLKSMGGKFTRIDLARPSEVFSSNNRRFVFIPYEQVLNLGNRQMRSSAYLIGVSTDGGASWRFVDGVGIDRNNIRLVIPNYSGNPPLPPVHTSGG